MIGDITKSLESARRIHGEHSGPHTSSAFWSLVFGNYYGQSPTGHDDKRWKELFTIGYPALRRLLNQAPAE